MDPFNPLGLTPDQKQRELYAFLALSRDQLVGKLVSLGHIVAAQSMLGVRDAQQIQSLERKLDNLNERLMTLEGKDQQ